jgi:hypothetical protein
MRVLSGLPKAPLLLRLPKTHPGKIVDTERQLQREAFVGSSQAKSRQIFEPAQSILNGVHMHPENLSSKRSA